MKLVIAEKNSVAQSLARVIGAIKRCDGYYEGNGYLVTWCVGHLVELSPPERYDERFSKWRLEDLPILPEKWLYEVSAATRKQFRIVSALMNAPGTAEAKSMLSGSKEFLVPVDSIICATDAGREGELIFRLVYNQCRCKKPFERLWISSMEDAAIREGFEKLKPGTAYDALYEAALCRERADWIVGMNATRLFSCLYGQTLAVGRVMTPTLAMVVMRDAQIAAFKPEPFWTVQIMAGGITASSRRFQKKDEADNLAALCQEEEQAMIRTVETKEKLEKPPLLYDLTSLQRDANRIPGFTAQQTLDYTQSLYEKKLVTYPRTDSRYLTEDMREMLPALIVSVAGKFGYAGDALRTDPVRPESVFDSSKVSDHHAIIPTKTMPGSDITGLSSGEKAVLQLISVRLLCAAAEDHRYWQLQKYERQYTEILRMACKENPLPEPKAGKKGRPKRGKVRALIDRLEKYRESVCLFIKNFQVPFDNNQAERDIRMVKVKTKVSGCFRSEDGAKDYLRIMSYVGTARKRGFNAFEAIKNAITGSPEFIFT